MVEFVIEIIIAARVRVLLVECNDVNDCLWVFLLLLFGNSVGLQCSLPFLGQTLATREISLTVKMRPRTRCDAMNIAGLDPP
jgi:hypothetical protein